MDEERCHLPNGGYDGKGRLERRGNDGGGLKEEDDGDVAGPPKTKPSDLKSKFDLPALTAAASDAAIIVTPAPPRHRGDDGVDGVDADLDTDLDAENVLRHPFEYSTPLRKGVDDTGWHHVSVGKTPLRVANAEALRLVTPQTATAADDMKEPTHHPVLDDAIEDEECVVKDCKDDVPDDGKGFHRCVGMAALKQEQYVGRGSDGVDIVCSSTSSPTGGVRTVVPDEDRKKLGDEGGSKMDDPRSRFRRFDLTLDTTSTYEPPLGEGGREDDDENGDSVSNSISTSKAVSSADGEVVNVGARPSAFATTTGAHDRGDRDTSSVADGGDVDVGVLVPLNRRARRNFPDLTVNTEFSSSDEEGGEDGDGEASPYPSWRHTPRVPPAPRASGGTTSPPPRETRIALPSPTSVWERFDEGGEDSHWEEERSSSTTTPTNGDHSNGASDLRGFWR